MLYQVTSPLHKDDHVEAFQRLLHKHGWYAGTIDGVYGQLTAQAVYRAKFWLGYPKPDHAAGDVLYSYLTSTKKLSFGMARLAAKRKANAKKNEPIRLKMLLEAMKWVGLKESPTGSNHTQFGTWYGVDRQPWCNIFVSWCGVKAGSKAFVRGRTYSYVPNMVDDARRGRNHLSLTHDPQTGDVVAFDWPGESRGTADHTGLFMHWNDRANGTFTAIEGNTAYGNNSNGGEVQVRPDRHLGAVQAFIHVGA